MVCHTTYFMSRYRDRASGTLCGVRSKHIFSVLACGRIALVDLSWIIIFPVPQHGLCVHLVSLILNLSADERQQSFPFTPRVYVKNSIFHAPARTGTLCSGITLPWSLHLEALFQCASQVRARQAKMICLFGYALLLVYHIYRHPINNLSKGAQSILQAFFQAPLTSASCRTMGQKYI